MIPIKNKKKNLEATIDEMRNFALNYVEKFAPSKQQLKTYLLKKYLRSKVDNVKRSNISDLIEIVAEDLEKSKFIDFLNIFKYFRPILIGFITNIFY